MAAMEPPERDLNVWSGRALQEVSSLGVLVLQHGSVLSSQRCIALGQTWISARGRSLKLLSRYKEGDRAEVACEVGGGVYLAPEEGSNSQACVMGLENRRLVHRAGANRTRRDSKA
jgi:hypothetical protein